MTSLSDIRSGVCQIWLSPTHFYIGRSSDIPRRMRVHQRHLQRGSHENSYMQRVYDQHGYFNYDIIRPCGADEARVSEQRCLDAWIKAEGCVNLNPSASSGPGMTGRRHSDETRRRIREARARQVFSEETRKKWSEARKGNKHQRGHAKSVETRHRLSVALKEAWARKKAVEVRDE